MSLCAKGIFHSWPIWNRLMNNGQQNYITGPFGKCMQWMRICSKCGLAEYRFIQEQEPIKDGPAT
jgi:hypothetical protein